jgi:hypothetical protein
MRGEKFPSHLEQFGMENFLYAGKIDFGILSVRMITLDEKCDCRQEDEPKKRFSCVR